MWTLRNIALKKRILKKIMNKKWIDEKPSKKGGPWKRGSQKGMHKNIQTGPYLGLKYFKKNPRKSLKNKGTRKNCRNGGRKKDCGKAFKLQLQNDYYHMYYNCVHHLLYDPPHPWDERTLFPYGPAKICITGSVLWAPYLQKVDGWKSMNDLRFLHPGYCYPPFPSCQFEKFWRFNR